MSALVTVFVTVYNIQDYLPRFFETMKNQKFTDYKLLILEDGSDDNSLTICKKYAQQDSRIEIIELQHIGISAARNLVKKYVHTPFVASADGDDYVEPTYLSNLVEAQRKTNADLVISRVIYRDEGTLHELGRFADRGELYIPRDEFVSKIPMLLDDRRLNFLYGKLYKTELYNQVEIEANVRPGSDTMINCRFLKYCNSIMLIDAADYNYIKYSTRAVTARQDAAIFNRLVHLNNFIRETMNENGFMSAELSLIIDKRILMSAIWMIEGVMKSQLSNSIKIKQIDEILNNREYIEVFNRSNGMLNQIGIPPQSGLKYVSNLGVKQKINHTKSLILKFIPKFVHRLYLKLK